MDYLYRWSNHKTHVATFLKFVQRTDSYQNTMITKQHTTKLLIFTCLILKDNNNISCYINYFCQLLLSLCVSVFVWHCSSRCNIELSKMKLREHRSHFRVLQIAWGALFNYTTMLSLEPLSYTFSENVDINIIH